jgi:hypothetical protein
MAAVYANMQPQEELAALFSRNLTLDPMCQPAATPAPAPAPDPSQAAQEEPKIVYISQHYNHSAHLAKQQQQQEEAAAAASQPAPRPASEPPHNEHAAVEQVLRSHSVDPSALSTAQLQLFRTADTPQQLRLLELWRASPPTSSADNPTLAWASTTLEQEEALARLRFEQAQQRLVDEQLQLELFGGGGGSSGGMDMEAAEPEPETVMSLDGTPLTPIQAGDGRWVGAATVPLASSYHYMEPYMASGYEEMARREYEESVRRAYAEAVAAPLGKAVAFNPSHADPVYAAMADQYGRVMAMREDEEML